tara:strand:- start:335728 stop:336051 length:324 start_codon:yes stop_codon:yes gene_type:complete
LARNRKLAQLHIRKEQQLRNRKSVQHSSCRNRHRNRGCRTVSKADHALVRRIRCRIRKEQQLRNRKQAQLHSRKERLLRSHKLVQHNRCRIRNCYVRRTICPAGHIS